ncbi:HEPN domain-containing protein [Candidatus Woesearchaeota archaeon]|nr:HEPN domain-containing protein [Candidatus Woesearchaeota archaeon]
MTKVSFFSKLQKQKKLQLVQPSEELCKAYLEKSEKSLNSAKATFGIGSYEDAVALAYYSMYYVVLALLFKIGVKCENHTAAIILLEQIFDINNELIQKAKTERVDKQYYVDFSVTKEEVNATIKTTELFNTNLSNFIDTLNKPQKDKFQQKAIKMLS